MVDQETFEIVKKGLSSGKPVEEIRQLLEKSGYSKEEIESVLPKQIDTLSKPLMPAVSPNKSSLGKSKKALLIVMLIIAVAAIVGYFLFFQLPNQEAIDVSVEYANHLKNSTKERLDYDIARMKYFKGETDVFPTNPSSGESDSELYGCPNLEVCQFALDVSNETHVISSWWADKILEDPSKHNLDAVLGSSVSLATISIAVLAETGIYSTTNSTDFSYYSSKYYEVALSAINAFDRETYTEKSMLQMADDEELSKHMNLKIAEKSADLYIEFLQFQKQRMEELNSEGKYAALFLHEFSLILGCSVYCKQPMIDAVDEDINLRLCKFHAQKIADEEPCDIWEYNGEINEIECDCRFCESLKNFPNAVENCLAGQPDLIGI